ncbi:MAG TPA: hypothetical protein VH062_16660 [Polyangiaceae bacterium]|nr:hypothetical protein [Polyangiaceae bacterium]
MNFFGHAVVATWRSTSPGFVLGAMLPDFANMLGARPPGVAHPELAAGVAFHHETDRVFHDAPTFKRLQLEARRTLREMGLPRPSALAVGHIGVEILLDGSLAGDDRGVAGYLAALGAAREDDLGAFIEWSDVLLHRRLAGLSALLAARGVTAEARSPDRVAFRVTRALESRPRLALTDDGAAIVEKWAAESEAVVDDASVVLIDEIRAGLALAGPPL